MYSVYINDTELNEYLRNIKMFVIITYVGTMIIELNLLNLFYLIT